MPATRNRIIEEIARNKLVEKIIKKIGRYEDETNLQDLAQDIYVELLFTDEALLNKLYDNSQLNYYITRIVKNNIISKTSNYYYKYKKQKFEELNDERID